VFELFINEMYKQLHKKLIKQNEELLKETNRNSPLFIQRKQLQKDIEDFNILDKRQDARAIQQIIERVEHMAMFNKKYDLGDIGLNKQCQSIVIPTKQSILPACSYQVSFKSFKYLLIIFFQLDIM
jgi:hypothetical protein